MSASIDNETEQDAASLEEELHELETHEAQLERRMRSLELTGPLAIVFAFIALGLAIGAMIVVLGKGSNDLVMGAGATSGTGNATADTMMGGSAGGSMMGGSQSSGMMMGAGHHGSFTAAQVAAAAHGTVYTQLGEYWVAPTVASVRAGKVTFVAKNVGQIPHELMIERMPMKFDAPMQPNEHAAQGMIDDMSTGQRGRMSVRLEPGAYMLFCNAPGHYAAGQHMLFTVKP